MRYRERCPAHSYLVCHSDPELTKGKNPRIHLSSHFACHRISLSSYLICHSERSEEPPYFVFVSHSSSNGPMSRDAHSMKFPFLRPSQTAISILATLLASALAAAAQQPPPSRLNDPANLAGERVSPQDLADTLPINHGAPALQQLLRKLRTRASFMLRS